MTLEELASKPAGADQIARARELCDGSLALTARMSKLMRTNPTRGRMLEFLEELNKLAKQAANEDEIRKICSAVGIQEPSAQDRLLAMQVGMLHEQNELLNQIAGGLGAIPKDRPLSFTSAVGAAILGNWLTR